MVDFQYADFYGLTDLERIVRILRAPGGCPWDQEQTHESIRRDLLEEAYEVVEAIDQKDPAGLKEELGDLLLQVVIHTLMEQEVNGLTLDDVADGISKKLIYRHPHVFGDVSVSGSGEVLSNWEVLKRAEKGQDSYTSTLEAVARSLPALWRAEKVQKKAGKAGFDSPGLAGAADKLAEETAELFQAVDGQGDVEEELGDLLFCAVWLARLLQVDPEVALNRSTDKFIARFRTMEQLAQGDLKDLTDQQRRQLWQQAKM